jgi:hypothetical protein
VPSLTRSHPFGAGTQESVPAIFWRTILHCGVLAGLGLALMLWGVRELAVAIGALVLISSLVSAVVGHVEGGWSALRGAVLAARVGAYAAAAAAVGTIAGAAGWLLVAICLLLTPAVRSAPPHVVRRVVNARRAAPRRF